MKSFGIALIILGILLSLFNIAGCQNEEGRRSALDWINNWGEGTAWAIRIGIIAVGIILVFANNRKAK